MRKRESDASNGVVAISAGDFSAWLHDTEASLNSRTGGTDVACGACRGCCRSSMFIHIRPEETQTIQHIPSARLFTAPGLPKGNLLMGYNDKGCCPMLVKGECSIYEHRPQTCRDFDCRIFSATGISADQRTQGEIATRVKAWVFEYENEQSREEHSILKKAAAFLQQNRDLFPNGSLPTYPVQLATLAVRVYRLFSDMTSREHEDTPVSNSAIAQAIVREFQRAVDSSE